ncbi:MAG: arginine decarboxylase, partial [Planctomycetota bacterium]
MRPKPMQAWTPKDSENLYHVPAWGSGFFSINDAGHVQVQADGPDSPTIDVHELVGQLRRRGVAAPILLRFDGLLRARVRQINGAFNQARREFNYTAPYRGVYPIKVNQERPVVEALLEEGRAYGMGLEVGSKPELIAGIALQAGEDALLVCNGYKDQEYVEMAMLASMLGITAILVIEKFTELETVLTASAKLGIRPVLGVRSKLSIQGSGRWRDSVGDRSKFGLSPSEVVRVVKTLERNGMLDCLKLTHFHVGSQITRIRSLKKAMQESTRMLIGLHELGARIEYFDVGGGLGIDYDGSHTAADSSRNYSLQEYANDVVWTLGESCREADIPMPTILSESGRGLAAHHAMLVGEVVGVTSLGVNGPPDITGAT